MRKPHSWDEVFMKMAEDISLRSKDVNTQVGTIIVSPDKRSIVCGFNGFVTGYPETEELWTPAKKYDYVIHSETNAILSARTDLIGWTLYCTLHPCKDCSKNIAQAGIKRVFYKNEPRKESAFKEDRAFVVDLFKTMNIKFERISV